MTSSSGLIDATGIRGPSPIFAPPYFRGGGRFTDVDVLVVKYRTTRESVRALIPDTLSLEPQPLVTSTLVYYGMSPIGSYKELIHNIEVEYQGKKYDYSFLLILDNEDAVYGGREMYGYPKVLGVVEFNMKSEVNGFIHGSVERPAGNPIVKYLFKPSRFISTGPLPPPANLNLNLRVIPNVLLGEKPSVRQFVPVDFRFDEGELWEGEASINYPSTSEFDPLHKFPVVSYESAHLIRHATASLLPVTQVFNF